MGTDLLFFSQHIPVQQIRCSSGRVPTNAVIRYWKEGRHRSFLAVSGVHYAHDNMVVETDEKNQPISVSRILMASIIGP